MCPGFHTEHWANRTRCVQTQTDTSTGQAQLPWHTETWSFFKQGCFTDLLIAVAEMSRILIPRKVFSHIKSFWGSVWIFWSTGAVHTVHTFQQVTSSWRHAVRVRKGEVSAPKKIWNICRDLLENPVIFRKMRHMLWPFKLKNADVFQYGSCIPKDSKSNTLLLISLVFAFFCCSLFVVCIRCDKCHLHLAVRYEPAGSGVKGLNWPQ